MGFAEANCNGEQTTGAGKIDLANRIAKEVASFYYYDELYNIHIA